MIAILNETNGYEINTQIFNSLEDAQVAMRQRYNALLPEEHEASWAEMSSCNDTGAILYSNGEDVFVWSITTYKG